MQNILDRYEAGIVVTKVNVQNAQPPEQVQEAFNDAVRAKQDLERQKNEGQAYYNDVVPKARGTASRLFEEANGYRARVIANAEGEASRFRQILVEYNKAPQVTRERLYLDMIQQILAIMAGVLVLASLTAFTVDQRQKVIVFEFGKIKEIIEEPGLHFKWPLIQNVRYFDNRILTLDALETESFITSEKNNVLVDFFVKWRIKDLRQYYQRVQGDEATAVAQLQQTVKSTLQDEFTKRTVHDVVAGEREKIMGIVKVRAGSDASGYGIEIVDVRVKRVELPDAVRDSVYRRMEAERKTVAAERRSQGFSQAEKI